MATPSIVQSAGHTLFTAQSSGYVDLTSNCAAGNLLVCGFGQEVSATRTYTVSDDQGGNSWAQGVFYNSTNSAGIYYAKNITGKTGTTRVTVTPSASTSWRMSAFEVQNASTSAPLDQTDYLWEGATSDNHTCSTNGIDTAADVIVFCVCMLNANATSCSAGANYTNFASGVSYLLQYRTSAGALTDETGVWSSTGTDRMGRSAIASFKAPSTATRAGMILGGRVMTGLTRGGLVG